MGSFLGCRSLSALFFKWLTVCACQNVLGLKQVEQLWNCDTNLRQHINASNMWKHTLPLLPSGEIVLNLLRREIKSLLMSTEHGGLCTCPANIIILQEYVPVCSHGSCSSLFAFVLKGNHSVGVDVPWPWFDFIKCKLKKILLEDKSKAKTLLLWSHTRRWRCEWWRTSVYLRQLKGPVRQQRRDPIGTFG